MSDKWETFLNVKQSIAIRLLNYMKYATKPNGIKCEKYILKIGKTSGIL